jgi:hypothetical protein
VGGKPRGLTDVASKGRMVAQGSPRGAASLVDDDAGTSAVLPAQASVGFRFGAPVRVSHYTLSSADKTMARISWTLEGRGGNGAWIVLDQRRDESFQWTQQLRPFRIELPGDYVEYRLRIDGEGEAKLSELELLQPEERQPAR